MKKEATLRVASFFYPRTLGISSMPAGSGAPGSIPLADSTNAGSVRYDYLVRLLDEHYRGKKDNSRKIWTVYMFLVWYGVFFKD